MISTTHTHIYWTITHIHCVCVSVFPYPSPYFSSFQLATWFAGILFSGGFLQVFIAEVPETLVTAFYWLVKILC